VNFTSIIETTVSSEHLCQLCFKERELGRAIRPAERAELEKRYPASGDDSADDDKRS